MFSVFPQIVTCFLILLIIFFFAMGTFLFYLVQGLVLCVGYPSS